MKPKIVQRILANHCEEYIQANIFFVEEELKRGKQIKNIPGYLYRAFEVDYQSRDSKHTEERKTKAKEQTEYLEAQEQQIKNRKKHYESKRNQAVEEWLASLPLEEKADLKKSFITEYRKQ